MTFTPIHLAPLSMLIIPTQPLNVSRRPLWCWTCNETTEHELIVERGQKYYRCECGEKLMYLIVGKPAVT